MSLKIGRNSLFLVLVVLLTACGVGTGTDTGDQQVGNQRIAAEFDVQGHRGCRGLYPENTIAGFIHALELGVTTLEMDVVISKDGHLIVSHEPWMSPTICLLPDGKIIRSKQASAEHNIYQMTLEEVQAYDCGAIGSSNFPLQQRVSSPKPTLAAVVDAVEKHISEQALRPVKYNIEIKSRPQGDNRYHPTVDVFAAALANILKEKGIVERTTFQCFDFRTLEEMHKLLPQIQTAALVDRISDFRTMLNGISFKPTIYSCNYTLLTDSVVAALHADGIQAIPWTVNTTAEMKDLIKMGVDGLITDYPDSLLAILK